MDALGRINKLIRTRSISFADVISVLNWNMKHTDAIEQQFDQLRD